MAINKEKNQNLQLTLSKKDYFRLIEIQNELSDLLSIDLNKSQTIAFLIKNYAHKPQAETTKETKSASAQKPKINYQSMIVALKDKLNVSYPRLSEILGIPATTLKRYAYGEQQPKGENEKIVIDALARYGIK